MNEEQKSIKEMENLIDEINNQGCYATYETKASGAFVWLHLDVVRSKPGGSLGDDKRKLVFSSIYGNAHICGNVIIDPVDRVKVIRKSPVGKAYLITSVDKDGNERQFEICVNHPEGFKKKKKEEKPPAV